MNLPTIGDADLKGKRVFVRGDIDVPLVSKVEGARLPAGQGSQKLEIADDTRLKDIWPTIEYLLNQDCSVALGGHLGRPGGKVDPALSSEPIAQWFLNKTIKANEAIKTRTLGVFSAFAVTDKLTVLENLRFDPREEANPSASSGQAEFAKELAAMADVYVNEAFASCGGEHASIVGVPKLLPHYAGLRLAKEVEVLSSVRGNPKRPLLAIIGGAKLDTKIPVISSLAKVADNIIVGGKLLTEIMSGSPITGMSNVRLLQLSSDTKDTVLDSIDAIQSLITNASTIVWNGPLGAVEEVPYQVGTRHLAELIAANTTAYKVVGGGDTIGFLDKLGLTDKFDWVSSGGGSMLKMLAGESLPGIEALLK